MKLTFKLRFHTHFGQSLFLSGDHEIFGKGDPDLAIPLEYDNATFWKVTFILPRLAAPRGPNRYRYFLRESDGAIIWDWDTERRIDFAELPREENLIVDSWNSSAFIANVFYTEPFQNVLLRGPEARPASDHSGSSTHTFRAKAPLLEPDETLCLIGSAPALGAWDITKPVLMHRNPGERVFSTRLDLSSEPVPIRYKYGVYHLTQNRFTRFEDGADRVLNETPGPNREIFLNDGFAVLPETIWKGAGVAIPVFSLRSQQSFGVGEFADLRLLVDWAKKTGLKLIQILPVNDTTARHTWTDSYPYAAISTFALHPLYLRLSEVAGPAEKKILAGCESERLKLNALPAVDYEAVMRAKMGVLRSLYASAKARVLESEPFRLFVRQNEDWLNPYALFCVLRDRFGTPDFSQWPAHRTYEANALQSWLAPDATATDEVQFHFFTQYHLHLQLQEAAAYAHANGVILKGDIPIGVYRFGADVWQEPDLYHTNLQAGAPPDPFADKGQNWGFPTYNWERMKADGYRWWRRRFEQMSRYFDAFRIDHILGFFRIWSIPRHAVEGILGFFDPALPVRSTEFTDRGIPFDRNRLVLPHITSDLVDRMFPPDGPLEHTRFFVRDKFGNYSLKPEFSTQRQAKEFFDGQPATPYHQHLQQQLLDILADVLLLETGAAGEFHFRFGIENTGSFQNLDPSLQPAIKDLYLDYFYRRQDSFWMKHGLEKLPALKRATNLLICGEDLGMVPACVPEVMRRLGLLALEVQRMPKDLRHTFSRPAEAAYLSVVTPSTHDMSTIRGWWREDRNLIQRFYNEELGFAGAAPVECTPQINRLVIMQHLASPAMWSIFQLQDLLGMDEHTRRDDPEQERINVPANPTYYWRYRMHLDLENLLRQDTFNSTLAQMLRESNR